MRECGSEEALAEKFLGVGLHHQQTVPSGEA